MEKWLSGRKRFFAKEVNLKRVPRVRIPPSPPFVNRFPSIPLSAIIYMRNLLLILYSLGLTVSFSSSVDAADDSRLKMYYGLAEGHYSSGNFPAADKVIQEILRLDPKHTGALELETRILLERDSDIRNSARTEVTLRAIDESLSQAADLSSLDTVKLRLARARLLTSSGETEAAIQELQQLTRQYPDYLEATLTLVALYSVANRWQSVEQLIPTIAAQPALLDVALYLEGRSAFARGRIGRARAKFEAALQKQPAQANRLSPSLYFYRSQCLDALKRPDEAHADLLKAIDSDYRPESTEEALTAARALLRHGEPARAITLLEALTLNQLNTSTDAWNLLGRAHRQENAIALAISAFNESLRLQPEQAVTLALRAGLLRQINDLDGALTDYQKAILLDAQNPALRYAYGLTLLQYGQIPAAAQALDFAAELLPKESEIRLLSALLRFTQKEHSQARHSLEQYFLQESQPATTAHQLAYLLELKTAIGGTSDFTRYCEGELSRKELLDLAGRASSPRTARQQIAAIAFFMAHSQHTLKDPSDQTELLKIAADNGSLYQPEALCARWLLGLP